MNRCYIGADVGGTKIAYGLFDEGHKLLHSRQFPSDNTLSAEGLCDVIIAQIRDLLREEAGDMELGGLGIGVPSYVRYQDGYVVRTANLPNLREFPMADYLRQRLQVPVAVDNDGNVAALAEHCFGAGKGFPHMLYAPVSTGLGLGIIIGGQLFHGSYGVAGEAGHMIADVEGGGLSCQCGHSGCFESHISGSKIVRHIAAKIEAGEPTLMKELCGGDTQTLTARHIEDAYYRGDEMAKWATEHMSRYLATWIYNLYQTFNINCYVLGGGLTKFKAFMERTREIFDELNGDPQPVHIKIAELGGDFGIIGAMELLGHYLQDQNG